MNHLGAILQKIHEPRITKISMKMKILFNPQEPTIGLNYNANTRILSMNIDLHYTETAMPSPFTYNFFVTGCTVVILTVSDASSDENVVILTIHVKQLLLQCFTRTFNIQFSCYFLPPEFFLVCFFIVFPLPVIDYFIFAKPIDHFFLLVVGQIGIFVLLPLNIWRALFFGQFSIIVTTLGMTLKIWDFLLGPLGFLSIISMVIRVSFWSSYSYWTGTLRLSWLCDLRPFLGRHLPNVGLPHINLEQKWRADDCPLPFIV